MGVLQLTEHRRWGGDISVTIKDIAKATNVSAATVSLVLNNKADHIPAATRKHIIKTAEEMKYLPKGLDVGLITKKTNTLGLILPDIANQYFAEIAAAAEKEAEQQGYSLILCNTNDKPQKDIEYSNILLSHGVDGVLFTMSLDSSYKGHSAQVCLDLFKKAKKPVVLIDRTLQDADVVQVMSDNDDCGYQITKHLLEYGHEKIGAITGPMGEESAKKRLYGYIRALQEYNLMFDPRLVVEGSYIIESGYSFSEELINKGATAIVAQNDLIALGIYRKASELGLKIPRDLSVTGVDNLVFSEFLDVPLTTMAQFPQKMGTIGVQRLVDLLNDKSISKADVMLPPQLIIRSSSGAPRATK